MTKWDELRAADPQTNPVQLAHLTNIDALRALYKVIGEYPYIRCDTHGTMLLTAEEYDKQLYDPDSRWECPHCGAACWWVGGDYGN